MPTTTRYGLSILALLAPVLLTAQTMLVQPTLHDAEPTRITIMWETSFGTESDVVYGITTDLGSTATGTAFTSWILNQIHTVTITGLQPATIYYYRAVTGPAISELYHFKTPALASTEAPTNICAMSDMQRDAGEPNKFWEVVHNGVIEHITDSMGPDLSEELSMVVIPGDLVDDGTNYASWRTTFFDPANPLFSYVPVYPVIGNHESNSPNYFNYFSLPQNGSPGYMEHWWYKDHSNVRIIGLNSNSGYTIQTQLDWLEGVLAAAAADPAIDFVFAQLHHPHHSELWIDGNLDYTGQVIARLEQFSTSSGKPSVHFFGHTHAYSRGQSRDHTHVMVNVATAGGNIDYWGEFAQIDYPEYSISQDEYGFVMVEVQAGADPRFTLKRFSLGDANTTEDNTLEDLITVRRYNNAPESPVAVFPLATDVVSPDCLVLKGTNYFDADGDAHGDTHWQVSTNANDWTNPVVDSWRQYQNWYFEVNTQAGDDLTDERVYSLQPGTNYAWRVRYRDRGLQWSEWSAPEPFTTGPSTFGSNLVSNGNAENSTTGWSTTDGVIESLTAGQCNGTSPYAGTRYFAVGGICTDNAFGRGYQLVSVAAQSTAIDAGTALVRYGGWFANWQGSDLPRMALEFLSAGGGTLGTAPEIGSNTGTWTRVASDVTVPIGTRSIRVILTGTRQVGSDNDSYFDELFLQLADGAACSEPYVRVPVRTFLEGPYLTGQELMGDDLRAQGLLPLTEPYTGLGFTHVGDGGGETIDPSVLETTGLNAVVDWVMLELRTGINANTVVGTRSCLLLRSGEVVEKDGISVPRITAPAGDYQIVLRHRNHLAAMTAQPIALGDALTTIDFSDPLLALHGTQAMKDNSGVRVHWSGDVTHDGILKYAGAGNDRDAILQVLGGAVTGTAVGYYSADVTMDGVVAYTGSGNDRDPILVNVGGTVLTAVRLQQVP